MQKHPLLSVKEAAELLRLEERSVRERLINGQLKGEKKTIGLREKWFVYSGSVEAALAKDQSRSFNQEILVESPSEQSEVLSSAVIQTNSDRELEVLKLRIQELEDALKKSAVEEPIEVESEVTEETAEESAGLFSGKSADKIRVEVASDDSIGSISSVADALWNNLICRYQEKLEKKDQEIGEIRAELAEKDRQIKLLPDFEKQKADWLKRIEEEHAAAQIQFERAKEKEEEARALETENERLKLKAEEAALSLERLQVIEKQMAVLKQPWWKKWFLPPASDE